MILEQIGRVGADHPVARTLRKATVFPFRVLTSSAYRSLALRSLSSPSGLLSHRQLKEHLEGAASWIMRAQDAQRDGGVSGYFLLHGGWAHSYPETTGYTIPTFLRYADMIQRSDIHDRISRMVDFVMSTQNPAGWFPGGHIGYQPKPSVFNSGMILNGLNHYYQHTGDERVLGSAIRCADWICKATDAEGTWSHDNYRSLRRTYNSEVSASLAELYDITHEDRYRRRAANSNDWVLAQQRNNGWFANCDNSEKHNDAPLTHLIGYTTRGLVVSGRLLNRDQDIAAAARCLEGVMHRYPMHSVAYLNGRLDAEWSSRMGAACVTGTAQLAVTLLLLNEVDSNPSYVQYAEWLLSQVAQMQDLTNPHPGLRGGLPSSFPIWGSYSQLTLNNWGVKYFMDAVLLLLSFQEAQ